MGNYTCGQAKGHYRRLNRNIVSRNHEDNREALRNTEIDAVENLDGCWRLSLRHTKPEFLGLLAEAIEYLDAHNTEFMHQVGGPRNFSAGIVYCDLINLLYEERELDRVFDRGKGSTNAMNEKDEQWAENHRNEIEDALVARIDSDDGYRSPVRLEDWLQRLWTSVWLQLTDHPIGTNRLYGKQSTKSSSSGTAWPQV